MRRAVVLVALTLLVAPACTDSGSGSDGDRTSSPSTSTPSTTDAPVEWRTEEFDVPDGSRPHDVAVSATAVWYTAQGSGELGRLDPATHEIVEIPLGKGSSPHGVILGPDGAPWITDSGLNAIVRVDPLTRAVRRFDLPGRWGNVNLNTAAFAPDGRLWFTGQAGVYGSVDPVGGGVEVFDAPGGRGPYGITVTRDGTVFYASLAGNHLARVDPVGGGATVLRPPTADQGTRRVWADSKGRVWCSQWNSGTVAVYDPADGSWREWSLPGDRPQAYAVYVTESDRVWLSDFGSNSLVLFDPADELFTSVPLPTSPANVRQLHGRGIEVWGAESAADKLVVVRPS